MYTKDINEHLIDIATATFDEEITERSRKNRV